MLQITRYKKNKGHKVEKQEETVKRRAKVICRENQQQTAMKDPFRSSEFLGQSSDIFSSTEKKNFFSEY